MPKPNDAVLVASGMVTVREWQKEPVQVPLREARAYDRFASELEQALGATVRVAEEPDPGAGLVLVAAGDAEDLPDELLERTLLLDASPSDHVHVVRSGLLGAIMDGAIEAWRRGDPPEGPLVFGRRDVAERMSGPVRTTRERFGYASIEAEGTLPDVVAEYLRAWSRPS